MKNAFLSMSDEDRPVAPQSAVEEQSRAAGRPVFSAAECGAPVLDAADAGGRVSSLQRTVDELVRENNRLKTLDAADRLTGLPNRRGFFESASRLAGLAARNRVPVCLCMAGVDQFNGIVRSCGRSGGDEVLLLIARALQKAVRESDVVARYGRDRFVLFLYDLPPEKALFMEEKLRRAVGTVSFRRRGFDVAFGMSSGRLSSCSRESLAVRVAEADAALRRTGASVGNRPVPSRSGLPEAACNGGGGGGVCSGKQRPPSAGRLAMSLLSNEEIAMLLGGERPKNAERAKPLQNAPVRPLRPVEARSAEETRWSASPRAAGNV